MTVGAQRRVIAVSSMVTFGMGFLGAAHKEETPSARFLIGIGFTYTFVSVFADLGAGDMAAAFAILIMISAILYEGEDLIGLLTQRSKGEVKPTERNKKKKAAGASNGTEGLEGFEGNMEQTEPTQGLGRNVQRLQRAQRPNRLTRR